MGIVFHSREGCPTSEMQNKKKKWSYKGNFCSQKMMHRFRQIEKKHKISIPATEILGVRCHRLEWLELKRVYRSTTDLTTWVFFLFCFFKESTSLSAHILWCRVTSQSSMVLRDYLQYHLKPFWSFNNECIIIPRGTLVACLQLLRAGSPVNTHIDRDMKLWEGWMIPAWLLMVGGKQLSARFFLLCKSL